MTNQQQQVLIFGTFDCLHPGHISLMRYAQQFGAVTAVIARDVTVKKHKGNMPFYDEHKRRAHVQKLGLVTPVLGSETDPYAVLDIYKPEVIVLGYDQKVFTEKLEEKLQEKNISATIQRAPSFRDDLFKSKRLRRALSDAQAGFVYINKPRGVTSHDVIYQLRKKLNIRKIGHAGTLDPLATGVLVCGIGNATTLLDWWHVFPKTYNATLEFGKQSDTYDSDGEVKIVTDDTQPTTKQLKNILEEFTGTIAQTPPPFSAKKVNGKKAYELARKGESVELKPQPVTIHAITLNSYNYPHAELTITCSTGTYIRSIIHDIGQKLDCSAIMTQLERTNIGPAIIDKSAKISDNVAVVSIENFQQAINAFYIGRES